MAEPRFAKPPRPIAILPAAVVVVLLASGGGVLAWSWAAGLVLATLLALPALVAATRGASRPVLFGSAELAGPVFLAVYSATGMIGTYPGAAVPALLHAGLCFAVFRAAAASSTTADGARRQAVAVLGVAGIVAAMAIAVSLAGGGPASSPAAAPFVSRGHLAAFLAAALPICVALAADSGPEDGSVSQKNGRARLLPRRIASATGVLVARAALGLVLGGIAFSVARGGIMTAGAVLLASLALFVELPKKSEPLPPRLVSAAAAVLVPVTAVWIALGPIAARLSTGALKTSAVERVDIVRASWTAFLENPILGHGAGGFSNAFRPVRPASVPYFVEHAHADLLELAVESGIAGLAALAIAVVLIARRLRSGRASPLDRLVLASVVGVAALLLAGLADFPLRLGAIAALAAWMLGIALGAGELRAAARRVHAPDPGDPPATRGVRAAAGVAIAALLVSTVIGIAHAQASALSREPDEASRVRATRLAPWNAGVWRESALAAVERGLGGDPSAFEDAAIRFDEAISRNPLDAPSLAGRARLALLAADAGAAIALFERAIAADPLHPSWRAAHIEALIADARHEEALAAVSHAIDARPSLAAAVLAPFVDAAPGSAASLVERVPADAPAHAELARLLADRGDLANARLAIERAAALDPERFTSTAADVAIAAGDEDAGAAILDRALASLRVRCAGDRAYAGLLDSRRAALALLLRRARIADAANELAPCAVMLFPEEPTAWSFAAEHAAATNGDPAFVEAAWRRAGELTPADPAPFVSLARFLSQRGDADGAMTAAREAEARSTCEGAGAREIARLLDAQGRRASAVTHLQALGERCGEPPWIAETIAALR